MLASLMLPITILCAVATWTACASFFQTQQTRQQQRIRQLGIRGRATVIGVQRPFLLDPCTRVYFEFVPQGGDDPVRCCHVVRSDPAAVAMALPVTGSHVQICYLAEQPTSAVIGSVA